MTFELVEMSVGILCIISIASCLIVQAHASGGIYATVPVREPPPPASDYVNHDYVRDESGHIHMQDPEFDKINLVGQFKPDPLFSVESDVQFQLFTPLNPTESQILQLNNLSSVQNSNFNINNPTRVLIHGWNSEGLLTPRFADAYFGRSFHEVNFIAVNWQKGSDTVNYFSARRNVREVAEHVAKFLDFMWEMYMINMNDLTIIGHSLGAHIAGIAGKSVKYGKVGKIVGLDPASPLFSFKNVDDRLDKNDASYVEVIHTCAGTLGFTQPIGHTSFYPNGGKKQPGCGWDVVGACAHGRAYELYIESITAPRFYAFQCDSFDHLQGGNCSAINEVRQMGGEPGLRIGSGIFYLETNAKAVFGKGINGVFGALAQSTKLKSVRAIASKMSNTFSSYKSKFNSFYDAIKTIKKSNTSMKL